MGVLDIGTLRSDGYMEINDFFNKVHPPYTLRHIDEFNAMYQRVYPGLEAEERRSVEEWVDYMIEHVERPQLAHRIYGVC